MTVATGTRLGRYEIRAPLGAGGMGEVYLAQDSKLDRKVALKILPAEVAAHPERMKRFVQEAKTASALNHPNIITIYEIEQIDSIHFIATEFIDGETLREHMRSASIKLVDALEVAIQTASALSDAHAAGIIHRDIKPENIMLRRDGIVKVLDFGLAKLTEQSSSTVVDLEAPTRAVIKTEPGVVVGTAIYMSPEQARGLDLDARTDIFSLGVLIYEMVAGRLPFEGSNTNEILASILNDKEPSPLARYAREVPSELERIVEKALRKDREERYQTAKDTLLDLRRLKHKLEVDAEIERTVPPELRGAVGGAERSGGQQAVSTTQASSAQTATVESSRTTSNVEYIIAKIKRHKPGVATILAAIILLSVAGIAYYFYSTRGGRGAAIESIAVLPFANQNHDPDSEYLSDGLTESIINSLTQLPNLKVIARSSVFHYKEKETDPMAVGKELGVRAVLTGRIIQRGDNLTISAELMDVRENKQLWGEQYERKVLDLLALQREIAKEISSNLRLKLSGAEQGRVTKHYTENPEAYQLYLKGRYFWNKFTPADHQRAAEYFNQAIAKDPTFALAYAGLSDTYGASATNSWIAPVEGYPKGKAAAKKALELDETLAEAHASLGAITMFYDRGWAAAEREYKRAIELNPNSPSTYDVYSYLLSATGRLDEGIQTAKRGLEADPLSVPLADDTGQAHYWARQYDEAIKSYVKSIEIDPGHPGVYVNLGPVYEQKGMFDEAIAAYQKAINASERTSQILGLLGHAYAASGSRGDALKILDELKEMSKQRYVSPYDLAVLYTGLGEKEQAIQQLNKAYEQRSGWLIFLKVEPLFDPLRSDPRFADLVRRMGL